MAIALPDPMATRLTVNRALSLAPDLDITVRAHFNSEIDSLYQLGAQEVVQPEFEAALEMGAHMLLKLGSSTQAVQNNVNRYRSGRYRDIQPARADYWGWTKLEATISGLEHRWYTLSESLGLVGQTLAQSNIRRSTGVTIMAIKRNEEVIQYPTGDIKLLPLDQIMVVGELENLKDFDQQIMNNIEY